MKKEYIYDLLNDVESDFSEYDEKDCPEYEKKKIKKQVLGRIHKKRKTGKWVAAACAVLAAGVLAAGPFNYQVNAGIKLVSYYISEWFGEEVKGYEECIEQQVTQNGVTVKLNSVVLDNNELTVASTIDVGKEVKTEEWPAIDGNVYVNGKVAAYGAAGGTAWEADGTFKSVMTYSLLKDRINDTGEMNIEIEMKDLTGDYPGTWTFKFTADGKKLAADTIHIPVEHTISLPDKSSVTFTEMTQNAMRTKIYFKIADRKASYDLMLKGVDEMGREVVFELKEIYEGEGYVYADPNYEEGNEIAEDAKEITLTPYAAEFPKESGRENRDYKQTGEPFTVNLLSSTDSGR